MLALHEIDEAQLAVDAVLGDEKPHRAAGRGYGVIIESHIGSSLRALK
jgi:hypothetical protein